MPQLEQIAATHASQFFWLIIVFGLIYFGIAKGMLGKVAKTVEDRETRIAADLAAAQAARADAQAAEGTGTTGLASARAEAGQITGAAKARATAEADARIKALDSELERHLADADVRIARARADSLAALNTIAADATAAIVGRLTGEPLSPDDAARAVASVRG